MIVIKHFALYTLLIFSLSCKKKTVAEPEEETVTTEMKQGLPDNPKSINGYLYVSSYEHLNLPNKNTNYFAAFSDPQRPLMSGYNRTNESANTIPAKSGNIDVGSVIFDSASLNRTLFSPVAFYKFFSNTPVTTSLSPAVWTIEGNGSFKPFKVKVTRGFPSFTIYTINSISKAAGFTFNAEGILSNYDSLRVRIHGGSLTLVKSVGTQNIVTFTSAELNTLNTGNAYLYIYGSNYSHQTINNQVYVFELTKTIYGSVYINS